MAVDKVKEFAPAKINLCLHVTGKLDNGYHLLHSLVVFADQGDEIEVKPARELTLAITGNQQHLAVNDSNIVLQAARLIKEKFSVRQGAEIILTKNLPVGAGIGGGSADAAATIRALLQLWKIELKDPAKMAFSVGADVPVCLYSQSAYMRGIGDLVTPVEKMPEFYVVLVNNHKPLLTRQVFQQYNPPFSSPFPVHESFAELSDLIAFLHATRNDLQKPAIAAMPEIAVILEALKRDKNCLLARMSGSGATCFGVFAIREMAKKCAEGLQDEYPAWWVKAGKIAN